MGCEAPGCDRDDKYNRDGFKVCKKHYQRLRTHKSFDLPERAAREWSVCSIDGCGNKSRTIGGRFCEKHYARHYRNGNFDNPIRGKKTITSHGYVVMYSPMHGLSGKTGVLYEHRAVLHDKIGPGVHPCHWCRDDVEWGATGQRKLVVDHLDNDGQNNSPDNLVQSCHKCNTSRGLFANWAVKHKDDPFLLRLFIAANDNDKKIVCEAV